MILWLLACAAPPQECGGAVITGADDLYGDQLPQFDLTLDDDALAGLATSPHEDGDDVHATFGFDGDTWDVGLHLKGSSSFRPITEKAAMKIDFHQWDHDATLHGVRRLTLNNMVGDPAMLAEELAYGVYAWLGLPASRHGYACVTVNGADYGLYSVVESIDEQLVDRLFDDPSGNLYEGTFGADIRVGATDGFILQEDGTPADHSDLEALANAFAARTDDNLLDLFDAHFDRDALFDAWATELYIGNIDGYISRGNNYLLYHEPGPDRWWMLPRGVDETFYDHPDVHDPVYTEDARSDHGVLYSLCADSPACSAELDTHIRHVMDVVEDEDLHGRAVDLVDRLRVVSRQDPMSPTGPIDTASAQGRMKAWIAGRSAEVETELE
jgi:spore coat protein CotH